MFKTWKKLARGTAFVQDDGPRVVLNGSLAYRRFLRSAFQAPARLNLAGQLAQVQLLDVSLKGALVDLGPGTRRPYPGTRGRLRLTLSATSVIAMDVEVARVQGSCVGLKCLHIDLDSVTHLRELMQRNVPDPTVLERDLGLLAQR